MVVAFLRDGEVVLVQAWVETDRLSGR